jgi:hypothetical protein
LTAFARIYGGSVDYNGALLSSPATPIQSTTKYFGGTEGAGFRYRWPEVVDGLAHLEFDQWRRELNPDQVENYRFVSLRFGVERVATARSPWIAGGGLRFLIGSNEQATIPDPRGTFEVTLSPGLGTNGWLDLGLRISPHVTLLGYWDGMRLAESDAVPITSTEVVFQPKSDMDVYGIRVLYLLGRAPDE